MQDILPVVIRPDMLANYLAIIAVFWTEIVLTKRWLQDRDPLTVSLIVGFSMQGIALIGAVLAEFAVVDIVDSLLVEPLSAVFVLSFVLSFPPLCYFYTGLFHPRNKWHLPLISFLAGNTTMFAVITGQFYEPLIELTILVMMCGMGVYVPLAVSCLRVAPHAARRTTRAKFRFVGLSAILFCFSFLLPLHFWILDFPSEIQQIGWSLSGIVLSISYITAWMGWTLPKWVRLRLQDNMEHDVLSTVSVSAVEKVEN